MKKVCGFCALFALITLFIVACGGSAGNSGNGGSGNSGNTVGLASSTFAQGSITLKKGESLTLVNQTGMAHIIANGTWSGNAADAKVETGAPVVNNVMVSSTNQSLVVGPFNTTGTFHYYCSAHPGMNLAVVVQ